jgi:predicted Holliday junction resolvase-like endonuclease
LARSAGGPTCPPVRYARHRSHRSNDLSILDDLKKDKSLFIRCPCCDDEFRASKAVLFDATKRLPPEALANLETQRAELAEEKARLDKRKQGIEKTEKAAESVNIGKVVEKIATTLQGFPAAPADCRSLFEPIDLIVFDGLAKSGRVDAIRFVEVKSGGSKLNDHQKQIRDAIQEGRVEFAVEDMEVES